MDLKCTDCGRKVGEMEKGKVMKGMTHRCPACEKRVAAAVAYMDMLKRQRNAGVGNGGGAFDLSSMFNGIFS